MAGESYLVTGLGNIGPEYAGTRHNMGFMVLDAWAHASNVSFETQRYGDLAVISLKGRTIYLLKPSTYMNLSGDSIIEVANFYKIQPSEIMVVHDELELAPGFVSLKWSGGLGGHNGLRSTKAVLGTPDFWRLRFGIGRPDNANISVADYVLSRFTPEQQELMQNVFSQTNLLLVKLLLSKEPKDLIQSWGKKNLI